LPKKKAGIENERKGKCSEKKRPGEDYGGKKVTGKHYGWNSKMAWKEKWRVKKMTKRIDYESKYLEKKTIG
jgi:hypothetical protein